MRGDGTIIFNALKNNANLFLMLCGHNSDVDDGAAYLLCKGMMGILFILCWLIINITRMVAMDICGFSDSPRLTT